MNYDEEERKILMEIRHIQARQIEELQPYVDRLQRIYSLRPQSIVMLSAWQEFIQHTQVEDLLKKFTVLLLYPDYLATQYGEETYLAHVQAVNAEEAIKKARRGAYWDNRPDATDGTDFGVLFVAEGHIDNLYLGE